MGGSSVPALTIIIVIMIHAVPWCSLAEHNSIAACREYKNDPVRAGVAISKPSLPGALTSALSTDTRRCLLLSFIAAASGQPEKDFCAGVGTFLRDLTSITTDDREASALHTASAAFVLHRAHALNCPAASSVRHEDARLQLLSQQLRILEAGSVPFGEPDALLRPVANFFGDVWAASLGADGLVYSQALRFMHALLFMLPPATDVPAQHQQIGVAAVFARVMELGDDIADNALFLAELAKMFLVAFKSVVVPIGWRSRTVGHAMLLEISYAGDKMTVAVYNAGSGSDTAHAVVKHKDRANVVPVVKFVNIPSGVLLNELDVIFHLLSMRTGPRERLPTGKGQYGPDDIYQRILQPLHRYHDTSVDMPSTRFQQSGTCTMKSQLAYLHVSLGDRFRLVKEDLQRAAVNLMTSVLDRADPATISNPHTWLFILRSVARNMARRRLKQGASLAPGGLVVDDNRFKRVLDKVEALAGSVPMQIAVQTTSVAGPLLTGSPFLDAPGEDRIIRPSAGTIGSLTPSDALPNAFATPSETARSMEALIPLAQSGYFALTATILAIPGHVLRAGHYSSMSRDDADAVFRSIRAIVAPLETKANNEMHWDCALALNKLLIMMWHAVCRVDALVIDRGSSPLLGSHRMSSYNLCRLRHSKFVLSYDRSYLDQLDDMFDALGHPVDSCDMRALPTSNVYRSLMTDPMAFRQWMMTVADRITSEHVHPRDHWESKIRLEKFHNQDSVCIVYGLIATGELPRALPDLYFASTQSSLTLSAFVAHWLKGLVSLWIQVEGHMTTVGSPSFSFYFADAVNLVRDSYCPVEVVLPGFVNRVDRHATDLVPRDLERWFLRNLYSGNVYESLTRASSNRFLRPRSQRSRSRSTDDWPAIHDAIVVGRSPHMFEENDFLVSRRAAAHRLTLSTMFRDQTRIPSMLFAWQSGRLDLTNYTHQDMVDFALFQGPAGSNGGLQDLCRQGSPVVDAVLTAARRGLDLIPPTTAREQRTILWLYALTFRIRSFRPASDAECRARLDLLLELEDRIAEEQDVWTSPSVRSLAHAVTIIASSVDDDCPNGRDKDWLKHLAARQGLRLYDVPDDDVDSGAAPAYRHIHHQADLFMAMKSAEIVNDLNLLADGPALWAVLHDLRERRRVEIGAACDNSGDESKLIELASSLHWTCVNGPNPACSGSGQQGKCAFDLMSSEVRCRASDGSALGQFTRKATEMYGHSFLVSNLAIGRDPHISIVKVYDDPPTFTVSPSSPSTWTKLVIQMPAGHRRLRDIHPQAVVMHTSDAQYELVTGDQSDQLDEVDGGMFVRAMLGRVKDAKGKFVWRRIATSSSGNAVLITNDLLQPIARASRSSGSSPVRFEFADPSSTATFRARHSHAFVLVGNDTLTVPDGVTSFDVFESSSTSGRCHRVVFYKHIYLGAPLAFSTCSASKPSDLVWEADPTFVLEPDQRLHGLGKHKFLLVRKHGTDRLKAFASVPGFTRLVDVSQRQSDRKGVHVDMVVARERVDRILVAFCHLIDRRYALALSMLKSVHLLTPWTTDEFNLLKRMVSKRDDALPEAIAVQTLVMFLDEDNRELTVDSRKRRGRLLHAPHLASYYRVHGNLPIRFRLLAYNDLVGASHDQPSSNNVILVRTRLQELRLLEELVVTCSPFDKFQLAARAAWLVNDNLPRNSPATTSPSEWSFRSSTVEKSGAKLPVSKPQHVYTILQENPLAQGNDVHDQLDRDLDFAGGSVDAPLHARLSRWLFVNTRGECPSRDSIRRFLNRIHPNGFCRVTQLTNQHRVWDLDAVFRDRARLEQYELPHAPDIVRPAQSAASLFNEFRDFEVGLREAMDATLRAATDQADVASADTISSLQLTDVPDFERTRSEDVVMETRQGADRLRQQRMRYELIGSRQSLVDVLDDLIGRLDDSIAHSDETIRDMVRKGGHDRRREVFAEGMGDGDEFEYQSLLHLLATASSTLYKARFPALANDDAVIKQLHGALLRHVLLVVTRQHCKRIVQSAMSDDMQSVGAELAKTRSELSAFEQIVAHPMIVVFELEAGLRLRPDQFNDILELLTRQDKNSFRSMILQRLMAAGKTFVLGTLMALAKADGYHLSIMVPPAALFEQNAGDMTARSAAFFGQRARVITFSRRAEDVAPEQLRRLYETLLNCIRNHQYVLMAPRTLHLLQNTYIDLVSRPHASPASIERLGRILLLLKERGAATFDEIDMTFDPKLEHNLPSGGDFGADRLRVHFAASLFLHLSTSGLVDFKARDHAVDAEAYASVIRPRLVDWAADFVSSSNHWARACALDPDAESPPMLDKDAVATFLSGTGSRAFEALPQDLTGVAREHLAYVHVQLHRKVPFALQGNVNQHYGRSNDAADPFPRPYVAANTPSETSEIASLWEIINRGAIMYLHSGLDREQAKAYIRWRKQKANRWEDTDIGEEGMQFKYLTSDKVQLSSADAEQDADLVREALLSRRPEVQAMLMDFVVENILNNAKVVERQITGNVQNLGSMFQSLQGYSGTLENRFIFPDRICRAQDGILLDAGANGQVVSRILHLGQDLLHVPDGSDALAARILRASTSASTTALIDIGAHFKGVRNVEVARDVLQCRSHVQAVIFYDEASNHPRVLVRHHSGDVDDRPLPGTDAATIQSVTGHSPIDTTAVFTYYDHRHITGSDVPQPGDANGIATISADTPLRDVLQGVMRMRKFLATQTVQFVAFAGVADVAAMLRNAQSVQFQQERKQNLQSVFQKIDDVVRDAILSKMYATAVDANNFQAMVAAVRNDAPSLFGRSQSEAFVDLLMRDDAAATMRTLLEGRRDALLNNVHVTGVFSNDERDLLRDAMSSIIDGFPLLGEQGVDGAGTDEGREQVQEQEEEQQQEQEQEQQQEQEVEVHPADPAPVRTDLDEYREEFLRQVRGEDGHRPMRRLNEIVRRGVRGHAASGNVPVPDGTDRMIHDNIFVTDRFCETRVGSQGGDDAVSRYRKTPFQVIVRVGANNDASVVLASIEELNLVRALESSSSLSTDSTLIYTTTPSQVSSLPGIADASSTFVQRLLADVNLYQGTLSVMNAAEWEGARHEALVGAEDAFRFYILHVLDKSDIIIEAHRPEFLISQWCPSKDDNPFPSIAIPGAPYADPTARRRRASGSSRAARRFMYDANARHPEEPDYYGSGSASATTTAFITVVAAYALHLLI